eukprot:scaffold310_cov335-Pavlova_lutheri.AAC.48
MPGRGKSTMPRMLSATSCFLASRCGKRSDALGWDARDTHATRRFRRVDAARVQNVVAATMVRRGPPLPSRKVDDVSKTNVGQDTGWDPDAHHHALLRHMNIGSEAARKTWTRK